MLSLGTPGTRRGLRATARHTQVRCESTEKKPSGPGETQGRTFKGQLYESAAARLERERAEQARFSKQRNEGAGGRNSALTFGISYPDLGGMDLS